MAEYAVDFWTLAIDAGWNEPALEGAFRWGFSGLNTVVAAAIELLHWPSFTQQSPSRQSQPVAAASWPGQSAGEESIELGQTQLHPAERQRRMNSGVCLFCGQAGHFLASCPARPKE